MPSKMRRYEEELAEWKAICDEMTAAEKRAVARFRPDNASFANIGRSSASAAVLRFHRGFATIQLAW